jgi:hypothetical protein
MLAFSSVAPRVDKTSQALLDDVLAHASGRLLQSMPARADAQVLVDLVEDDLREALAAVEEVHGHFSDIIDALVSSRRLTPSVLVEVSDEQRVVDQLDSLIGVASQLRRRLSEAASKIQGPSTT